MPAGRPSTYDPELCERAYDLLREGRSLYSVAAEFGVCRTTLYNWMEANPEFLNTVNAGQAASAAWWEERLRDMAIGGEGNAAAVIFGLKNRGREEWRDKTEVDHGVSDTLGQVLAEVARRGNRLGG